MFFYKIGLHSVHIMEVYNTPCSSSRSYLIAYFEVLCEVPTHTCYKNDVGIYFYIVFILKSKLFFSLTIFKIQTNVLCNEGSKLPSLLLNG